MFLFKSKTNLFRHCHCETVFQCTKPFLALFPLNRWRSFLFFHVGSCARWLNDIILHHDSHKFDVIWNNVPLCHSFVLNNLTSVLKVYAMTSFVGQSWQLFQKLSIKVTTFSYFYDSQHHVQYLYKTIYTRLSCTTRTSWLIIFISIYLRKKDLDGQHSLYLKIIKLSPKVNPVSNSYCGILNENKIIEKDNKLWTIRPDDS